MTASDIVTRHEWRSYVSALEINQHFPGIQGVGYAVMLKPDEMVSFEQSVRAEGFPDFSINPHGNRDRYSSILYLEPFDWRNRRAFGYDMYSNDVRQAAMDYAIDTGDVSVSGMVTLVQETDTDVQAGFLMYLPVYMGNVVPATIDARRKLIKGFVYSPFRARNLLTNVIDADGQGIRWQLYDQAPGEGGHLLYDSRVSMERDKSAAIPTIFAGPNAQSLDIYVGGRAWTLIVGPEESYFHGLESMMPYAVLIGGLFISGLLYASLRSIQQARKVAEDTARDMSQSASLMSQAVDQSSIKAAITTANTLILEYVNARFCRVAGKSKEELLGQSIWDTIGPRIDNTQKKEILDSLARNTEWTGELSHENDEGEMEWEYLHISPAYDADQTVRHYLWLRENVTDRHRLQNELKNNYERFHSAFENVATGAVVISQTGIVEVFNDAAQVIFGYTAAEVIGNNVSMLMPAPFRAEHDGYIANYTRTGERKIIGIGREVKGKRKSGEVFPMHLGVGRMEVGGKLSFIGSITDLTSLKQVQDKLEAALTQAQAANKARSDFLAAMSHELRTPLNAIIGFSDIIRNKIFGDLNDKYSEYATDIHTSGEHLLSLVNDILDISAIDAGKREIIPELIDLHKLIQSCLRLIEGKAAERGITVHTDIADDLPEVWGDSRSFKQILINLLTNSMKFTGEGGMISVSAYIDSGMAVLSVRDTGTGIDPGLMPRLLEPFSHGEYDPYKADQGWGLGLAISNQLIQQHGGTLTIESDLGLGTTVFVQWPNQHLEI